MFLTFISSPHHLIDHVEPTTAVPAHRQTLDVLAEVLQSLPQPRNLR